MLESVWRCHQFLEGHPRFRFDPGIGAMGMGIDQGGNNHTEKIRLSRVRAFEHLSNPALGDGVTADRPPVDENETVRSRHKAYQRMRV